MTGSAVLHRYCPDHTPELSLCGIDVAGAGEVEDVATAAETMALCVVCEDLCAAACDDACLAARSKATS